MALFCAPLFIGLGRTDFKGDEPIYSFAVDLILKTGDWLTPRSIPDEHAPFLEKPPLKFWIVAAPIRLGLLPHDEFGQRFWDAAFGAASFLYVFAIGVRLAGPLCGLIAVFTLFSHQPLLYEHGLRSNNMEAALLLGYCGAVCHTLAWSVTPGRLARRLHPQAVGAFFVLGFMTKFVAAVFLPFILVVTALTFRHWRSRLLEDWRAWAGAMLLILAATVPWFLYQTAVHGNVFWQVLIGEHVYKRMTGFLDPAHLQPWHYYFSTLYGELASKGMAAPVLLGTLALAVDAVRRRWDAGVLLVLWFAVPFVAISFGTSKLYHYAYPFLPPLALGAGYLPTVLLGRDSVVRRRFEDAGERVAGSTWVRAAQARVPALGRVATIAAIVAFTVAAVTVVYGRFGIRIGELLLFRNASIARPLIIGVVLLLLASSGKRAGQMVLVALLVTALPVDAYRSAREHLGDRDEPMQMLRACLRSQVPSGERPRFYVHAEDPGQWRYFYYFRDLGWDHPREGDRILPLAKLFAPAEQQPVLLTVADHTRVQLSLDAGQTATATGAKLDAAAMSVRFREIPAVRFDDGLMLLLPGPYAVCAAAVRTTPPQR